MPSAKECIVIEATLGEHVSARCTLCNASGLLMGTGYGYPGRVRHNHQERLIHTKSCKFNEHLTDNGVLRVYVNRRRRVFSGTKMRYEYRSMKEELKFD